MGRRKKGNKIDGWVNFNKPYDMTSTQAVGLIRRKLNAQKVGHAGTLDPLATGILPIALGEATKTIQFCQDRLKTYLFTVTWGEQRSTDDAEGEVTETSEHRPAPQDIESILPDYTGEIEQTPPIFSAIKVQGARAYDLARDGETPELKSRQVYIESLELTEHTEDTATFRCVCGKGTYIRALGRDMARQLGTAGYISALMREKVGPFALNNAISLDIIDNLEHSAPLESVVLPLETVLDDIPALALLEGEATRLKNGQKLTFVSRPDVERLKKAGLDLNQTTTALALYKDQPLALVTISGPEIQPLRVLNL